MSWLRPGRATEVARRVVLEAEAGVDDDVPVVARDLEEVLDDARSRPRPSGRAAAAR